MTPELETIKREIAQEMEGWAALFITNRVAFLRSKKIEATGSLIDSMHAEINQQARAEAVEMLVYFEEHGRFLDMKRMRPPQGGGNVIAAIQAWIEKKGFSDRFTKRFMEKYPRKTVPANVLNKIAWGIVVTRSKGKFRRRRWYNKPKTAAVGELFNDVAALIPDIVAEQITKNLATANR